MYAFAVSKPPGSSSDDSNAVSSRVVANPNRWLLVVILGFGLLTWAAFLYIGVRARQRSWLKWAGVYGALLVVSVVLNGAAGPSDTGTSVGTIALLIAWIGGSAHAAAIRRDVGALPMASPDTRLDEARRRIERRTEGRRLADQDPRLAREVGLGRPDVPGADDFGLVDVNHASREGLCNLPGITPQVAERVIDVRDSQGAFVSVEDVGVRVDLPPSTVDAMREYAIFL